MLFNVIYYIILNLKLNMDRNRNSPQAEKIISTPGTVPPIVNITL